jgi:predicted ATPase/DNA-binding CsgD family transcriptional regulator
LTLVTADEHVLTGSPPVFDTRFIGRQREITSLGVLVGGKARLVTLVGVGGSGKTRLAAEMSARLIGAAERMFGDGVVWADLSSVSEPGDVALSVADALGIRDSAGPDPALTLVRTLADRRLLLIMDNSEEMSTSCRGLIDDLLAGCPGLVVVATSRVPLRSPNEQLVPVPPMGVDAGAGERSEAAELFYDRAGRVLPEYPRVADDLAVVNALCERVDGLPLAIELAAPWIRTLSARDLFDEIDRSAEVLASRDPGTSDQHRSMRAVLDSTWRGLSESSRTALRRLAVFVGGFSADAAEAVTETSATTLDTLIDLSLVRRQPDTVQLVRYGLHELVRRYAAEMLHRLGPDEVDLVRDRHLRYFLDLYERARADVDTPKALRWMHVIRRELPSAGAALRWAHDHGRAEQALRMTAALAPEWGASSASGRYRVEFEAALGLPWDPASATQARARADVLNDAGFAAMTHRDWETARRHFEEAAALFQQLGDQVLYGRALSNVGWAVSRGPDPTFGPGYVRQALAICRRVGDLLGIAWSHYDLGEVLFVVGQDTEAERHVLEGLRQLTELGVSFGVYCSQVTLGHAYRRQARWAEAIEAYVGALHAQQRFLHRTHGDDVLAGLAVTALALDRADCAARLFGACRTWAETVGDMSLLNPSRDLEQPRVDAEGRLGDPDWAWNYDTGRRLTTERAMIMAEADAQDLLLRCRAPLLLGLTEREMDVVRLVAEGLTDSAIAEKLVLSPRTVQGHLRSVFLKLGVKNRSAAVHRATQVGLLKPA